MIEVGLSWFDYDIKPAESIYRCTTFRGSNSDQDVGVCRNRLD